MSQLVYFNGKLVPEKDARISILSTGFLYGAGLFETMRTYNRAVFALDRHITRMLKSKHKIRLGGKISFSAVKKAVLITIRNSSFKDAYVRLNLWQDARKINIACFLNRLKKYPSRLYQRGAKTIISSFRVNELSPLCGIKSFNYLLYRLARQNAQDKNADEAILLNSKGYIAEAAASNVFIVKDNTLITPGLESGCLPGITRSIVLELAKEQGIRVKQTLVKPRQLYNADEAFLTNSLIEIMPIFRFGTRTIGRGSRGEITRLLMDKYTDLTKARCYE